MIKNLILCILIGLVTRKSNANEEREMETLRHMQLFLEYDRLFNVILSDEYYFENYGTNTLQFKNFIEDKGLNLIEDTVQEWLKFDNMFLKPIKYVRYKFNLTALFVILQTKFLAISHYISFLNCSILADKSDKYSYLRSSCQKVSLYFYSFGLFHTERLILIIKNLLNTVKCDSLNQYFEEMTHISVSLNLKSERNYRKLIDTYISTRPTENIELFTITNELLVEHTQSTYLFFERLMHPADTSSKHKINQKLVEQTISFWEIAIELSDKIEKSNQLVQDDETDEFGKKTEIFRSLQMDLLRDIEARKLLISTNRSISKIGLTEFFLQMIINVKEDGIKKGPSDSQSSASTHCDIFYVLRPYSKLNAVNRGSIEPLFSKDDQTSPFGFIIEN